MKNTLTTREERTYTYTILYNISPAFLYRIAVNFHATGCEIACVNAQQSYVNAYVLDVLALGLSLAHVVFVWLNVWRIIHVYNGEYMRIMYSRIIISVSRKLVTTFGPRNPPTTTPTTTTRRDDESAYTKRVYLLLIAYGWIVMCGKVGRIGPHDAREVTKVDERTKKQLQKHRHTENSWFGPNVCKQYIYLNRNVHCSI